MPTQAEILDAIDKLGGWCTYAQLREYFNMHYDYGGGHSNSSLPQRLNSLRKHGYITKINTDIGVVFVRTDYL